MKWFTAIRMIVIAAAIMAVFPGVVFAGATLTGSVQTTNGEPIQANILIGAAQPKSGSAPYCRPCYPDCQKRTKAGVDGKFNIASLGGQLRFQILIAANGYAPRYINDVDPSNGPLAVTLIPVALAQPTTAPAENCLHGRIVDADGKPVMEAVIEPNGISSQGTGKMWGNIPDVDPVALSDENGDFLVTSRKPFYTLDVKVSGNGFANKMFSDLSSGAMVHDLTVTEGATVIGRVMFDGKPVPHALMGMVSVDRTMEHFTGNFDMRTDANGRFMFVNLPPDVDYYVYGHMDSFKKMGAISIQTVHAGKDGETTDVGNLTVGTGYQVSGRVELADGKPVPRKGLTLSREDAWDSQQVTLASDGRFDFQGVPAGPVNLSFRSPGYRISAKNASLDRLNPFELIGRVDGDATNLTFLLEKGPELQPDYNSVSDTSDLPENKPLHGIEGGAYRSDQVIVSGRVTDRQTGEPLTHFRVTPGRDDIQWNRNRWDSADEADGSNGDFTVYVNKRWPQAILKVEADGYLPSSIALDTDQTNISLALQRGTGPGGYVVNADNKPVADAQVLLLCEDSENPQLDSGGRLFSRPSTLLTKTAADGHFGFAPQMGMTGLAAASSEGFTEVSMDQFASDSNLVLQPYGIIKGMLNRPNGPGVREDLDIKFWNADGYSPRVLQMWQNATTDAAGKFEFDQVPAGNLLISYQVKTGEYGYQDKSLQRVTLKPGQNLDVTINAGARETNNPTWGRAAPAPKRIPGQDNKGIVLLPDGKPGVDAQVVAHIQGQFLSLGHAAFEDYEATRQGSIVRTGPDGRFDLPVFEREQEIIAVSDAGFAKVSLEAFKRASQIKLQAWGKIDGVLRCGQFPASNVVVVLSGDRQATFGGAGKPGAIQALFYDQSDFAALTDNRGRFSMTYVPPGTHSLSEVVPVDQTMHQSQLLGDVVVKPGKIAKFKYGGNGRVVTGKLVMSNAHGPADFSQGRGTLQSGVTVKMLEQVRQAKGQADRAALFRSQKFQKVFANSHVYWMQLTPDGSFKSLDVPPGKYEVSVDFFRANRVYVSSAQVVVPATRKKSAGSVLDLGRIELKEIALPATTISMN